ncbi:MAG: rod-binding protein [Alphaproteobacteria bacterium]|nr:rod-binding protein [Alphaproteobacteria bacterium]
MDIAALQLTNAARAAAIPNAPVERMKDVDATARDFEAVFISQMFEQMFADVKTDGLGGGGSGERIFRSMMVQEIGRQMANQGGMGLADTVKRELIALQEHGRK